MSHRNLDLYGFDSYPHGLEIFWFNKKIKKEINYYSYNQAAIIYPSALYNDTDNPCLNTQIVFF